MFGADTLLDSISPAVIATGPDGIVVSWNRAAEKLYGEKAASVLGRPLRDVVPADHPLAEPESIFNELRAGRSWSTSRRTGGTLVFFTASPVHENGDHSGFVIVSTPLDGLDPSDGESERLHQREEQLRQTQQIARIASWTWHLASDTIEGSPELFEVLGLPAGELTRAGLMSYVHPDDRERLNAACELARFEETVLDVEHRFRPPAGGERVLHLRGRRVLDPQGHAIRVAGVIQDVTERRRLEQRLLQAERVSSLGRLAASVAHEFNNVLMSIQPFIDLLSRKAGADPTVKMATPRIADAVIRGKRITQEILRFTRIAEPSRAPVNVSGWLHSFQAELQQLSGPDITVRVEADPSLTMLADTHQLRQVVANLVVNAHHAMPNGGSLEIRAVADTMPNGDVRPLQAVHFTISDTGVGMTQETLRYIFEPLFTTKTGGTGLGLAVASQVVQQHEGHIYAESTPGSGTTFHIVIPACEPPVEVTGETASPSRAHAVRPGLHITMVEDEDSVGAGLVAIFELEGISVDWIKLGAQAVVRIAARLPDVVILDVGLPDIDGIKLYEEIAQRWPDLPVLISTGGSDDQALLRNSRRERRIGFLQKPYESDALLAALEELLKK